MTNVMIFAKVVPVQEKVINALFQKILYVRNNRNIKIVNKKYFVNGISKKISVFLENVRKFNLKLLKIMRFSLNFLIGKTICMNK